jgi:hypothetical protein
VKIPSRRLTYALLAVILVLVAGGSYWRYQKWLSNPGDKELKVPPSVKRTEASSAREGPTPTATGIKYFDGGWENIDSATRGLTRLNKRVSDATVSIRAWGKCYPTDCDWGEVKAEVYTQSVSSDVKGDTRSLGAIFKTHFKETTFYIRPELDDRLRLESATRFTDQSGRSSFSAVYVFQRAR